jgi:hypothetical protein
MQETGGRSQETGVRSQESGVRADRRTDGLAESGGLEEPSAARKELPEWISDPLTASS